MGGTVLGMPWLGVLLALLGGVLGGVVGVVTALLLPASEDPTVAALRHLGRTGELPENLASSEAVDVVRSLRSQLDEASTTEAGLRDKVATTGKQLRRANAALLEAKSATEHALQARDAFLQRMSHELRTPLNAVIGYSDMLVDELDEDLRPDAEAIRQSGRYLLGLVTSVLDLTQLQSGQYEVVPEDVGFNELVTIVVDAARAEAAANQTELVVDVPEAATASVDRRMVQSILFNLVKNACKYTSQGTVTVRVRVDQRGTELFVGDTGIGMTERQIEAAFRPFEQADASSTRRYDGSGLGLAVCRGFAEAMGGTIAVDSAMGEGARVTVQLPAVIEARAIDTDEHADEHTMLLR